MPAQKRHKTKYPGVYFINGTAVGIKKTERIFYITYRKNGKQIHEKAGRQFQDDMTPARAATTRAAKVSGKQPSNKERRLAQKAEKEARANKWTVDRLWEEYKKQNPNLKGLRTYSSLYNLHIEPEFGSREPADILPLDVKRVSNRLLKIKSPQTVQHVLELLRRLINFGVNNKLCQGIDFKIDMPKVDNEKTEDLTPEQLQALLKAIDDSEHPQAGPIMKMALFTGMRRGEIFKLKWKDINLERGFINIKDPKGGPDQKIPLNDAARAHLDGRPKTSGFVFPGRKGDQWKNIRKPVNAIKKAAELPADFRAIHGLRHVYASMLASSGKVDMYHLQRLLTHKDPKTTQRYAHLRNDTLKRASDLAGSIIEQATTGETRKKWLIWRALKNIS